MRQSDSHITYPERAFRPAPAEHHAMLARAGGAHSLYGMLSYPKPHEQPRQ